MTSPSDDQSTPNDPAIIPAPPTSPDGVTYDNPMKPLLWLLIPFVLVLVYGFMA